jgi:hypothetical protein
MALLHVAAFSDRERIVLHGERFCREGCDAVCNVSGWPRHAPGHGHYCLQRSYRAPN